MSSWIRAQQGEHHRLLRLFEEAYPDDWEVVLERLGVPCLCDCHETHDVHPHRRPDPPRAA